MARFALALSIFTLAYLLISPADYVGAVIIALMASQIGWRAGR